MAVEWQQLAGFKAAPVERDRDQQSKTVRTRAVLMV
jgi:hypothetical protein